MSPRAFAVLLALGLAAWPSSSDAAKSALDPGSWVVGGGGGVSRTHYEDATSLYVYFSPSLACFVVRGLAVGASVAAAGDFEDSDIVGDVTGVSLGAGPTVQYYLGPPEWQVHPFVGASYYYNYNRIQYESDDFDYSSQAIDVTAGAVYLFVRNIGVHGSAYYHRRWRASGSDASEWDAFGARLGLALFAY